MKTFTLVVFGYLNNTPFQIMGDDIKYSSGMIQIVTIEKGEIIGEIRRTVFMSPADKTMLLSVYENGSDFRNNN